MSVTVTPPNGSDVCESFIRMWVTTDMGEWTDPCGSLWFIVDKYLMGGAGDKTISLSVLSAVVRGAVAL